MIRTVFLVDGMHCPMCQSHVNDIVRKCAPEAKVTSSYKSGKISIDSKNKVDREKIKSGLAENGYIVLDINETNIEKQKGIFSFLFGNR